MKTDVRIGRMIGVVLIALLPAFSAAQSNSVNEHARQWGKIGNAAFSGKSVVIVQGGARYSSCDMPSGCLACMTDVLEADGTIQDIVLAGERWLVLSRDRNGVNGAAWGNLHPRLSERVRKYYEEGDVVWSVAFNTRGDWAVVTDKHFSLGTEEVSSAEINDCILKYGDLIYVHFSESTKFFRFENGYAWWGSLGKNLQEAIRNCPFQFTKIKYLDDGKFFLGDASEQYSSNFIGAGTVPDGVSSSGSSLASTSASGDDASATRACPNCSGSGIVLCTSCFGSGKQTVYAGGESTQVTCTSCSGNPRMTCPICNGSGLVYR